MYTSQALGECNVPALGTPSTSRGARANCTETVSHVHEQSIPLSVSKPDTQTHAHHGAGAEHLKITRVQASITRAKCSEIAIGGQDQNTQAVRARHAGCAGNLSQWPRAQAENAGTSQGNKVRVSPESLLLEQGSCTGQNGHNKISAQGAKPAH